MSDSHRFHEHGPHDSPQRGPRDGEPTGEPIVRDRRRVRADADTPLPATDLPTTDGSTADGSTAGAPATDSSVAGGSTATDATDTGTPGEEDMSVGLTDAGLLAEIDQARTELAERTADLQRLSAEYANYRRRVDRDRDVVREQATVAVATSLLGVLDDVDRARANEELSQGFRSVADSLDQIVAKLGLARFGEVGDRFDPRLHEALLHGYSADVTEPTCTTIISAGYRMGDRIVRPARVAVSDPETAGGGQE